MPTLCHIRELALVHDLFCLGLAGRKPSEVGLPYSSPDTAADAVHGIQSNSDSLPHILSHTGSHATTWCIGNDEGLRRTHQIRFVHGFAHAVQGVWSSSCHHEVWRCLDCSQGVHSAQIRCRAAWFKTCNHWRHKPGPKPACSTRHALIARPLTRASGLDFDECSSAAIWVVLMQTVPSTTCRILQCQRSWT